MASGNLQMDKGLSTLVGEALADRPSYQAGGAIGPGGVPQRPISQPAQAGIAPQGQGQPPVSVQQMQAEIQRLAQQHPEQVAQIRQAMMEVMQTGELTTEELNTIVQLATAAAQNPELYPQIRAFAIQNGLAEEADLPAEYDQGLVFALLLAAQSIQQGGGGVPQSDGQPPQAAFEKGGALPESSKNTDGSIAINAHEGEYVIPADVVRAKGTDFFDKMVGKDAKA